MRSRRAVALVVVIALTANACSSSTRDRAAPTTTTATTTTAAAAPGQDAMIAELSKAGIEVVDSPVPVTSSAPVTLTHAQVRVMAADADASAGIRGSDLDAAAGGAPTPLPFSSFIGAYVLGVDTPAAAYARTLMGDQDLTVPAHAVFPLAVLALFAADAVAAFDPLTSQPSGFAPARFVGRPAALETSCSSVTKAIFDGVD
ncbi:MAG: hypothetical protein JWN39_3718, partial [Ilumatobacteraceae bacterium]|nr:hypothetical protein [Ilumatobacteraceae bacterium]